MRMYDILNNEEFKNKDVSVYVDSEVAKDFIDDIIANDEEVYPDYLDILENQDVVIVSRVISFDDSITWYVDGLLCDKGQVYNECDIAFIDKELFEIIDFDRLESNDIVVFECEKDEDVKEEEDEELENMFNEMTNDLLLALASLDESESDSVSCLIKRLLRMVWEISRDTAMDEVADILDAIR